MEAPVASTLPLPLPEVTLGSSGGHRTLEAGWSRLREGKGGESRSVVSDSLRPRGLYSTWDSPGQTAGVGSLSLLQQIFLTQELNWGLLHCRRILYQLSYQGGPHLRE